MIFLCFAYFIPPENKKSEPKTDVCHGSHTFSYPAAFRTRRKTHYLIEDSITKEPHSVNKQKGKSTCFRKCFFVLVAEAGLEPTTSGL